MKVLAVADHKRNTLLRMRRENRRPAEDRHQNRKTKQDHIPTGAERLFFYRSLFPAEYIDLEQAAARPHFVCIANLLNWINDPAAISYHFSNMKSALSRIPIAIAFLSAIPLTIVSCMHNAQASMPVRKAMAGCVRGGVYINDNGYRIRVRNQKTRQPVDLRRYEGLRLGYEGALLPGDVFYVSGSPRILGRCR